MAGNWKEPEFDFSERSDRVTLLEKLIKSGKIEKVGENTNTIYTILE